jgi:hypothetical protein
MKVGEYMAGGQPKKFKSGQQMIDLWQQFCDQIRENGYIEAPTQTAFGRWLSANYTNVDRRTIYNSLNEYFPMIKKEFETIRADVISEGTMLGKYQPTMSIFCLKNWCAWRDNPASANYNAEDAQQDELSKSLSELAKGLESDD